MLDGEEVTTCPFIWVDQDFALVRGWIQGFPKKLGEVWMTRTFGLGGPADPGLQAGARHGATCSARGRAIADMTLTIDGPTDDGPKHNAPPIVNVRHFPRLAAGRHDEPQVHELVRAVSRDRIAVHRLRRRGDAEHPRGPRRGARHPRAGRGRPRLPLHVRLHRRRPRDREGADVIALAVSPDHFIGGERVASRGALRGHLADRRQRHRRDLARRREGGRRGGARRTRRVPRLGGARSAAAARRTCTGSPT